MAVTVETLRYSIRCTSVYCHRSGLAQKLPSRHSAISTGAQVLPLPLHCHMKVTVKTLHYSSMCTGVTVITPVSHGSYCRDAPVFHPAFQPAALTLRLPTRLIRQNVSHTSQLGPHAVDRARYTLRTSPSQSAISSVLDRISSPIPDTYYSTRKGGRGLL